MNDVASQAPMGRGREHTPFGNGASVCSTTARQAHRYMGQLPLPQQEPPLRAAQEGIVFSFMYGMEVMQQMGIEVNKIHAATPTCSFRPSFRRDPRRSQRGHNRAVQHRRFRSERPKGAGIGAGIYRDNNEAFRHTRPHRDNRARGRRRRSPYAEANMPLLEGAPSPQSWQNSEKLINIHIIPKSIKHYGNKEVPFPQ